MPSRRGRTRIETGTRDSRRSVAGATQPAVLAYNRRLDGLRALAVGFVLVWHWLPEPSRWNWLPNGELGVDLFFVLSGYLITSILLAFRERVENHGVAWWRELGRFYVRRSLRLFPLYYAVLLVLFLWPDVTGSTIRASWSWYALFAQNFWMHRLGRWDGLLSHFWTLAVEEQFYLAWGIGVLLLPRKWLPRVAWAAVAAAIGTRAVGLARHGADLGVMPFWNILTPTCLDGLGLGAIAALGLGVGNSSRRALERWTGFLALPALLFIPCFRLAPTVWYLLGRSAVAVLSLRALMWALALGRSPGSWMARLIESAPVVEFGKRSYGLYVFHHLVPFFWASGLSVLAKRGLLSTAAVDEWNRVPAALVAYLALLTLLAFGSWRFFEAPINRLKERFAP